MARDRRVCGLAAPPAAHGFVRDPPKRIRDKLFVKFFTESLILAQDERWRRA
jgi:hypothetical protein